MNLIEVEDLHVRYGKYEAVKGVSFTLAQGEILGIVGESGSGKSTLAKTLMGLSQPSGGTIRLNPTPNPQPPTPNTQRSTLNTQRSTLQMIFQDAVGSLNPRMTVGQTLEEVLRIHRSTLNTQPPTPNPQHPTSTSLLRQVGLSEAVLNQYPREMSGGQCQRVSIARALACHPDVLIADEPVSALDVSVQARVLNLLRDLRHDLGLTLLLIAHDLAVVKNVCDRVCVMEHGRFVDSGPTEAIFTHPTSPYTRRLLSAVPQLTQR